MHHISGVHLILSSSSQCVTSLRYLLFGFDAIVSWFWSELWKVEWRWKSSSPASSLFSPVFHRWEKIIILATLSINHPCHSDPMWDRPKRWTSFSSVPTIFVPTSASSQVLGCLSRSFNDGDYPYYGGLRSRIIRRIFLKSGVNEGVFASPAMVTPNLDKVGLFANIQFYQFIW